MPPSDSGVHELAEFAVEYANFSLFSERFFTYPILSSLLSQSLALAHTTRDNYLVGSLTSSSLRSSTNRRRAAARASSCSSSGTDMRTVGIFSDTLSPLENMRKGSREHVSRRQAYRGGYLPPPREEDCPPRPDDGLCECCGSLTFLFHLDHCHKTGKFRGWVCIGCNTGTGLAD